MKQSHLPIILLSFLLGACASPSIGAQAGEPVFLVTTKNTEDQVSFQYENDIAYIDVSSPTGIGSAKLELESGVMPEEMTVRLHLTGLEQFRLTSVQQSIAVSVSSGDTPYITQKMISPGNEATLLPGNALWMNVEIVSGNQVEKIPLEEGHFEITLPKDFLKKAGNSFEIEWIDFYR